MTENNIQVVKPKRFTLAKILRIFFITFGLVFLYAPILSLIIYSFNASKMMTVLGG